MTDESRKYPFVEFDSLNLIISRELVGKSLEFKLNDYHLQFELPTPSNPETLIPQRKDDEEENIKRGPLAKVGGKQMPGFRFRRAVHEVGRRLASMSKVSWWIERYFYKRSGMYNSDDNVGVIGWAEQEDTWIPDAVSVKRTKLIFLGSPEFKRYKIESGYTSNQLIDDLKEVSKRVIELWLRT